MNRRKPLAIALLGLTLLSCNRDIYSHLFDSSGSSPSARNRTPYYPWVGGSYQSPAFSYLGNSQCMGGGGWANPGANEGTGGFVCGDGAYSRFSGNFGIATDGTYLYVSDRDNRRIRTIDIATRQSATIAGNGIDDNIDGIGIAASCHNSLFLTYGGDGYVYMSDNGYHVIRRLNTTTYEVTTIAGYYPGGGVATPGSADGFGTAATFNSPMGVTSDGNYLYICDQGNNTIRRLDLSTFEVTTIAGLTGSPGTVDGFGSAARFENLMGLTTDGYYLYITQSWGKNCVRMLNLDTLEVTTLAGNPSMNATVDGFGSTANFQNLYNIACDGPNLYTVDWDCGQVRKIVIATGVVTSLGFGIGNNTGICYVGGKLYVTAPNYHQINAYW